MCTLLVDVINTAHAFLATFRRTSMRLGRLHLLLTVCIASVAGYSVPLSDCNRKEYSVIGPVEYFGGVQHLLSVYVNDPENIPKRINVNAVIGNVTCQSNADFLNHNGIYRALMAFDFPRQLEGQTAHITFEIPRENDFFVAYNNSISKAIRRIPNVVICETDKPIYRPGEEIKARVLIYDGLKFFNLKPSKNSNCSNLDTWKRFDFNKTTFVELKDPKARTVKQWSLNENSDISYKLFPDAVEGEWQFSYGEINGQVMTYTFKVEHYVLPRYKITKKFTSIPTVGSKSTSNNVTLSVCSRYTNGLIMEGQVNGEICLCGPEFSFPTEDACGLREKQKSACTSFDEKLENGCVSVYVDASDWRKSASFQGSELVASIEIVEPGLLEGIKDMHFTEFKQDNTKYIEQIGEIFAGLPTYVRVKKPSKENKYLVKVESFIRPKKVYVKEITEEVQEFTFPPSNDDIRIFLLEVKDSGVIVLEEKEVRYFNYKRHLYAWPISPEEKVICPGTNEFTLVSNFNLAGKPMFITSEYGGKSFNEMVVIDEAQKCQPRDDSFGHFSCEKGKRQCLNGWEGPNCLQKQCNCESKDCICTLDGKCECNLNITLEQSKNSTQLEKPFFVHTFPMQLNENHGPALRASVIYFDGEDNLAVTCLNVTGLENCASRVNTESAKDAQSTGIKFSKDKVKPGESVQLKVSYKSDKESAKDICYFNAYDEGLEKFFNKEKDFSYTMARYVQDWREYLKLDETQELAYKITPLKNSFQDENCDMYNVFVYRDKADRFYASIPLSANFKPQMVTINIDGDVKRLTEAPKVRDYFPESWIFTQMNVSDYDTSSKTKQLSMDLTAPDTITRWKSFAYCLTAEDGLYIPPSNAELIVEKLFHIDMKLPKQTKRGEIVHLPVSIFFESEELRSSDNLVTLKVETKPEEFEIITPEKLDVCVTSSVEGSNVAIFALKPKAFGKLNITVTAEARTNDEACLIARSNAKSQKFNDGMEKPMNVVPEGERIEQTQSVVACLEKGEQKNSMSFKLPGESLVEDSVRAYVAVSGNLLGSASSNLGDLVQKPYGCGEQNMITVSPSVSVLQYMMQKNVVNGTKEFQSIMEIKEKAKGFIEEGWAREQQYKLADGSFSAFGESDKIGSTWLTAFVLDVFADAKQSVPDLDVTQVFEQAILFLATVQDDSSCIVERGKVIHSEMVTNEDYSTKAKSLSLSIHVMNALQNVVRSGAINSTEVLEEVKKILNKTDDCIKNKYLDEGVSIERTGMLIYSKLAYTASQMADASTELGKRYDEFAETLMKAKSSVEQSENIFWGDEKASEEIQIQSTAYSFLALEKRMEFIDKMNVVRWLISKQKKSGGFYSTQDTIMGLKAMSRVVLSDVGKSGMQTTVTESSLSVDKSHKMEQKDASLYKEFLVSQYKKPSKRDLDFKWNSKGSGCIQLTSTVIYNDREGSKVKRSPKLPFKLEHSVEQNSELTGAGCGLAKVSFCIKPEEKNLDETGMLLATLTIPTGYAVDEISLRREVASNSLSAPRRYDRREQDGAVHLYFDGLSKKISNEERCATVELLQKIFVEEMNKASLSVEDYYDRTLSIRKEYSLSDCAQSWKQAKCRCLDLATEDGRKEFIQLGRAVCKKPTEFSIGQIEQGKVTNLKRISPDGYQMISYAPDGEVAFCNCAKDKMNEAFSRALFTQETTKDGSMRYQMKNHLRHSGSEDEVKKVLSDTAAILESPDCYLTQYE